MTKLTTFLTNFFLTGLQHIGSIIISVILIIVGMLWSKVCLYIGLGLLASNFIVALVGAIRIHRVLYGPTDDPAVKETMENLSADPQVFLSDIMNAQEKNRHLHGADLLTLSDDDLFETVYFQNIAITDEATGDETELDCFVGARRVVYVLNLFDAEIQNGGLCQFFVNSSREVAPYVSEALTAVGADSHRTLFEAFVAENHIDLTDLSSFQISSVFGFKKQTKRFDFDAFDDAYYELPPLQEAVVSYIKAHIDEF